MMNSLELVIDEKKKKKKTKKKLERNGSIKKELFIRRNLPVEDCNERNRFGES